MKYNMRKAALAVIIMLFFTACPDFNNRDNNYADFIWHEDGSGGIIINGYTGPGGTVVIPEHINGVPVRTLDNTAFARRGLTSVSIPSSVTYIGYGVFDGNPLYEITVDQNNMHFASVDGVLFNKGKTNLIRFPQGRRDLTYIIPNSVTSIRDGAFILSSLTSINIPNSVISIGVGAFAESQLTSVIIGNSVTSIGERAFLRNYLNSISIPESVTSIGEGAFWDNHLTNAIIPDSVTSIGEWAFARNHLTSVIIPNGVTSIERTAFADNRLSSISIHDSVTTIGDFVFLRNHLTSVIIPDSVTYIGERAFGENNLTSVTIGANVELGNNILENMAFGSGFEAAYQAYGRTAGTYTRPDTGSATWTLSVN